ncbi:MAG: YbbR-like domain-containing protein [Planctomycetota bacterium]
MRFRERLWTYALVSAVALLIWYWAAAETRDQDSSIFWLMFEPAPQTEQIVTSQGIDKEKVEEVSVEMEGSRLALQRAAQLAARQPLILTAGIELPTDGEHKSLELVELLQSHERLTNTGVRILKTVPAEVDIVIDTLVPVVADIKAVTPGVEPEGLEIDPSQAVVKLPSRRAGEELSVEVHVPQTYLDRLEPGVINTVENLKLRLAGPLANEESAVIQPSRATVTFTVRSRIKETTLPTVRVQIAGPPEDNDEYVVQIENNTIADVTVKADRELISRIERGDAVVVALVHLSHQEKELGVESKPVTCFMALPRDSSVSVAPTLVEAEVSGSSQPPLIRLQITERSSSPQ